MVKTLVVGVSRSGNNDVLARYVAGKLGAKLAIVRFDSGVFSCILGALLGLSSPPSLNVLADPEKFDRVVLCAPMMLGSLPAKVRGFLLKYKGSIKELVVVSLSGGGNNPKGVRQIRSIIPCDKVLQLGLDESKKSDSKEVMAARVDELSLKQKFGKRIDSFLAKL